MSVTQNEVWISDRAAMLVYSVVTALSLALWLTIPG